MGRIATTWLQLLCLWLLQPGATSFTVMPGARLSTPLHFAKKLQRADANHEKLWQPLYDRLTEYKEKHGDCNVSGDEELLNWVNEQREQYEKLKQGKKVRLTKKRAIALERIGVLLDEL